MRTNIYIDGFNLYYASLKDTPYRWLDLKKLSELLLRDTNQIHKVKLFTAKVSGTEKDVSKPQRQDRYFDALKAYIPEMEIYLGHFLTHPVRMPLAKPTTGQKYAEVIKTEEKGSDVNLSVHFLNDAWLNDYDCAVIVSNDSDLAQAMHLVRKHHPNKSIGLFTPERRNVANELGRKPRASKQLAQHAHFHKHITPSLLGQSQLPETIPGTNLTRPQEWR